MGGFLLFILWLGVDIVCGFTTKKIGEEKGYGGGFAWGLFLGILGIVVQAVRPFNTKPLPPKARKEKTKIKTDKIFFDED